MTVNDIAKHFHLVQDKAEIARVFSISAITEHGMKDALISVMNAPPKTFVKYDFFSFFSQIILKIPDLSTE